MIGENSTFENKSIKLEHCTIIIPTYNRAHLLKRILNYLMIFGCEINLIIADSGDEESKNVNRGVIEDKQSKFIRYFEYSTTLTLFEKLEKAISNVQTRYSLIIADDDFVNLETVAKGLQFIQRNDDYSVVQGRVITYQRDAQSIKWGRSYPLVSIEKNSPLKRLNDHLSNYKLATIYGIHRTEILKKSLMLTNSFSNEYRFGELLQSMIVLMNGKLKSLDLLFSIREIDIDSSGQTLNKIDNYIKEGVYREKYKLFKQAILEYSKELGFSRTDVENTIERSIVNYLINHYPSIQKATIKTLHKSSFVTCKKIKRYFLKGIIPKYITKLNNQIDILSFGKSEQELLEDIAIIIRSD